MTKKAFTLIELLVVVAIIGILAAVGVTTYNGFQEKAKVNALKSIHSKTVKYISSEVMKCDLGEEFYAGGQPCPATSRKAVQGTLQELSKKFKNLWVTGSTSIHGSPSYAFGQVNLSTSQGFVMIRTCYKKGCASADTQETKLDLK
jgi:prepilin-type N-terminal cleavage/methylation domain-containing protein